MGSGEAHRIHGVLLRKKPEGISRLQLCACRNSESQMIAERAAETVLIGEDGEIYTSGLCGTCWDEGKQNRFRWKPQSVKKCRSCGRTASEVSAARAIAETTNTAPPACDGADSVNGSHEFVEVPEAGGIWLCPRGHVLAPP